MANNHRQGGKFTGSHTTVTDASALVVDAAVKLPQVSKIGLGLIKNKKNRVRRLAFREIPAGWEVTVCGNVSIHTVYIYTNDRESVKEALGKVRL
jgi:hypothetical protein